MSLHPDRAFARTLASAASLPRFPADMVNSTLLSAIQSSLDGVVVIDAMRQIVLVNRKAERMFGYPARHLLDQPIDVLLSSQSAQEQGRRIGGGAANRFSSKKARLELRGRHASGQEFPVQANVSRVMLGSETYFAVALHDAGGRMADRQRIRTSDLRRLAVFSQQASETEKKRFSKELYDDIGQRLSVLKLDLDWLENSLPEGGKGMPERVAQMRGMLDKVINLTRSMASTLRPPLLDDFGLMAAVEWMAENFSKRTGISCSARGVGMPIRLGDPAKSAVFRVVQEALLNIERHAHAEQVHVVLERGDRHLALLVEDDGIGMQADSENKAGCYGLIAMQERIFVLGGTITINNIKPHGVAIHATIPLTPPPS